MVNGMIVVVIFLCAAAILFGSISYISRKDEVGNLSFLSLVASCFSFAAAVMIIGTLVKDY